MNYSRVGWALAFTLITCEQVLAWGDNGHSIVAELAHRRLSPAAHTAVADLIGPGTSLASLSSWADDFKFTPAGTKTKRWHFMNVDVASPDPGRACALDPKEGDCIVAAIKREVLVLSDPNAGKTARADALKFLVHLIGDLHQPLHCSERAGDAGGNGVALTFQGKGPDGKRRTADVSLHQLWDETLIDAHSFSWGAYATEIETSVMPGLSAGQLQGEFVAGWADECFQQGSIIYKALPPPPAGGARIPIDEVYQATVQPMLDRQLALAGLRLAAVLNEALKSTVPAAKEE